MRLHLNTINEELARRGHTARLAKGDGYFYFHFGEAADWVDRTVRVRTVNSLTLKQWMEEFRRLKELNERIMRAVEPGRAAGAAPGATAAQQTGKRSRT